MALSNRTLVALKSAGLDPELTHTYPELGFKSFSRTPNLGPKAWWEVIQEENRRGYYRLDRNEPAHWHADLGLEFEEPYAGKERLYEIFDSPKKKGLQLFRLGCDLGVNHPSERAVMTADFLKRRKLAFLIEVQRGDTVGYHLALVHDGWVNGTEKATPVFMADHLKKCMSYITRAYRHLGHEPQSITVLLAGEL